MECAPGSGTYRESRRRRRRKVYSELTQEEEEEEEGSIDLPITNDRRQVSTTPCGKGPASQGAG